MKEARNGPELSAVPDRLVTFPILITTTTTSPAPGRGDNTLPWTPSTLSSRPHSRNRAATKHKNQVSSSTCLSPCTSPAYMPLFVAITTNRSAQASSSSESSVPTSRSITASSRAVPPKAYPPISSYSERRPQQALSRIYLFYQPRARMSHAAGRQALLSV